MQDNKPKFTYFPFFNDTYQFYNTLELDQKDKLIQAIYRYYCLEEEPEPTSEPYYIGFMFLKRSLDSTKRKYYQKEKYNEKRRQRQKEEKEKAKQMEYIAAAEEETIMNEEETIMNEEETIMNEEETIMNDIEEDSILEDMERQRLIEELENMKG